MDQVWTARVTNHSLQLYRQKTVVSFDRTGRFLRMVEPGEVVRRSLSGQLLRVKTSGNGYGPRAYEQMAPDASTGLLNRVYQLPFQCARESMDREIQRWLEATHHWTVQALEQDATQFRKTYLPVSILPPGEYQSLVVQISEGCSYNRCLFCDFYRNRSFHIKNETELDTHLTSIRAFLGQRLQDRTGVFLGDGNALVIPTRKLLAAMERITAALPEVPNRFCTFMDTFNLTNKSPQDLAALHANGLETVYVGLESGYNPLRKLLQKPGSAEDALQGIAKMKEAGFRMGVIVLAGVGSRSSADAHFADTLAVLRNSRLEQDDLVFVSPFIEPENTAYRAAMRVNEELAFSYEESVAEAQRWIRMLRKEVPAKVSLYSIMEHFY